MFSENHKDAPLEQGSGRVEAKVAIITGGGQGIGKITAGVLAKEGFQVVLMDKDQDAGLEAVNNLKPEGKVDFQLCDVSSVNAVRRAMEEVVRGYGRIDVLINNAGLSINKPIQELKPEEWSHVLNTNLTGAFLCVKYAAEELKKNKGAVINICSTRAYMSEPNTEAYSASKGGLLALTHSLAISLGSKVRVNSISPGWIDVSDHKKKSERQQAQLSKVDHHQHPVGRVGKPQDVAQLISFLVSDKAGFITGQDFIIDGGMTRKMIYE